MRIIDRAARDAALDPEAIDHWMDTHVPDWGDVLRLEVPEPDDETDDVTVVRWHSGPDLIRHTVANCPHEHPGGDPDSACQTVTTIQVAARFPLALLRTR